MCKEGERARVEKGRNNNKKCFQTFFSGSPFFPFLLFKPLPTLSFYSILGRIRLDRHVMRTPLRSGEQDEVSHRAEFDQGA